MTTDQLTLDTFALQEDVLFLRRAVADALPRTQGALTTNALRLDDSLADMDLELNQLIANLESGPDPILTADELAVLNTEDDVIEVTEADLVDE